MSVTCTALIELDVEMRGATLGDERLSRRLASIVAALSAKPADGFPMAMRDQAATEGFYRFLRNKKVTSGAVLKPHIDATVSRCGALDRFLVLHDTSQFQFNGMGEREGLGVIESNKGNRHAFFGHFALAIDPQASNRPLGLLGLTTFARTKKKFSRATRAAYLRNLRRDPAKESLRWGNLVEEVEAQLNDEDKRAIHVMDRESDSYVLIARMRALGARFVIRATAKRRLFALGEAEPVAYEYENWEELPQMLEREVSLSARLKSMPYYCAGRHPVRGQRVAKLCFSAKTIRLKRASNIPARWPIALELNAVRVHEVAPPRGEEAIEWLLLTTEPIATAEDVAQVVDTYRARWVIEEYFKALKTGCAFEKRQLESYKTLGNALAVLAPVAWKILLLRSLERDPDDARTKDVVTVEQLDVLREFSPKPPPKRPNVEQVLTAVAALGGHLSNNGRPGWQVLWRGYQELATLERAWTAARQRFRCDQS